MKASGTHASTEAPNTQYCVSYTSGSTRKYCRSGSSSAPPATLVMRRCCLSLRSKSRLIRPSAVTLPMVPMTLENASRSPPEMRTLSFRHASRSSRGSRQAQDPSPGTRRSSGQCVAIPGWCSVATMERMPPPKPRQEPDASLEVVGPASYGAGIRTANRGIPSRQCRAQLLNRSWQTCPRGRRMSLSAEMGTTRFIRFVQQSPCTPVASKRTSSTWTLSVFGKRTPQTSAKKVFSDA